MRVILKVNGLQQLAGLHEIRAELKRAEGGLRGFPLLAEPGVDGGTGVREGGVGGIGNFHAAEGVDGFERLIRATAGETENVLGAQVLQIELHGFLQSGGGRDYPKETTFQRVLAKLDAAAFERILTAPGTNGVPCGGWRPMPKRSAAPMSGRWWKSPAKPPRWAARTKGRPASGVSFTFAASSRFPPVAADCWNASAATGTSRAACTSGST